MREKSQEKKNGILEATLELVAEQGFHGTSISQIANKADVNVGSIYYYFESKDDIINALYLDCKSHITKSAFADCDESDPPEICLKKMVRNIVRFFSVNSQMLAFIEQYENSPYISAIVSTAEYAEIMEQYLEMFNRLQKQNLIKDLPVGILQSLISGAVVSLARHCLADAEMLKEETLVKSIDAIWDMARK
jgi:AcrR family transcriptional regulator